LVTTDSIDPNTKFESKRLVLALRKIDLHSESSVVDSMVSWPKDLGLDLENEMNAFSLIEVEATLCKIFGERLARLLREDLEVALLNE
jgi:hypothetical protein